MNAVYQTGAGKGKKFEFQLARLADKRCCGGGLHRLNLANQAISSEKHPPYPDSRCTLSTVLARERRMMNDLY